FCLIFVPFGHYDEPEILPYANPSMCPKGADVRHAYTVVFELNKPEMKKFESELAGTIKDIATRAIKEGFSVESVDICQNMINEYTTPRGWHYTDEALHTLVGLTASASEEELGERCVEYAKAVAEMEKMSHHTRHVIVCGESLFEADSGGKYYIKSDPDGGGAIENMSSGRDELVEVARGESTVFRRWQLYNFDANCIIVGLSKSGVFRMAGKVRYQRK
ncbi:MAG: hypothetical protein QGF38_01925, partial [Rhodospirillales bacterium]|nr:hypothetical protein [Rhodospirillales bacterium]